MTYSTSALFTSPHMDHSLVTFSAQRPAYFRTALLNIPGPKPANERNKPIYEPVQPAKQPTN